MADIVVCSNCGGMMPRFENVDGVQKDWTNDTPVCAVCRGVPGAKPMKKKHDVLGGFAWKRDPDTGEKVPK